MGKFLPLMEEFYSLQGEGYNVGMASYFVRLGGCDIGCYWCDEKQYWDSARKEDFVSTEMIIEKIINSKVKTVVITGGEPLKFNLDFLCSKLNENGIKTHLETSGANKMSGFWDWICISPKIENKYLLENLKKANELKVIITGEEDFKWAEYNSCKVSDDCFLYLQPEWSRRKELIPLIIDYILLNPKWKISVQLHKFLHIS